VSIGKPTAKDEEMMEQAIAEAQAAIKNGKAGVGALLLWQDEVLAIAHNMHVETGDITAHAEMVVLRKAAKRLDQMSEAEKADLTLYSTLEPCLMCLSAISFVGIKRVVYSALTKDAKAEDMVAKGITADTINPLLIRGQMELVSGVKREQGIDLLRQMGKNSSSLKEYP
jgi:tRNA(adenine34) deaminase